MTTLSDIDSDRPPRRKIMRMTLSDIGRELIIKREALRLKSYLDSAGVWTIGIGHTLGVRENMSITKEQAYELFKQDIEPVEDYLNYVNSNIKRKFKQHEFDALVSFIHQIGLTYFAKSTCLKKIREGCTPEEIAKEFPRWCYITDRKTGKKVICDAVKNRHIDEKVQYLTGY